MIHMQTPIRTPLPSPACSPSATSPRPARATSRPVPSRIPRPRASPTVPPAADPARHTLVRVKRRSVCQGESRPSLGDAAWGLPPLPASPTPRRRGTPGSPSVDGAGDVARASLPVGRSAPEAPHVSPFHVRAVTCRCPDGPRAQHAALVPQPHGHRHPITVASSSPVPPGLRALFARSPPQYAAARLDVARLPKQPETGSLGDDADTWQAGRLADAVVCAGLVAVLAWVGREFLAVP